jgi:nucleoid-associated protein YgaU
MFVHSWIVAVLMALALIGAGLAAGPSSGAGSETRHVVRPGETLWSMADARYEGDPRAAVWRIRERNRLGGEPLQPGMVLYLPP